jgi:hypothetical protein
MQLSEIRNYQPINTTKKSVVLEIAKSLESDGWQGMPIVLFNGFLITGSHRVDALCQADLDYRFEVPTVDLNDVFEEAGLDLEETMDDESSEEPWDSNFCFVLNALPVNVVEKYGIQW